MTGRVYYPTARHLIRSGDLLAFTHRPWWPWRDFKTQMVRVFTRSEYSHVGTAWRMGGRAWIIEAVMPRPRIVPLSMVVPAYWLPLDAPWSRDTERVAMSVIGRERSEYSQWQAMAGGLGTLRPGTDDLWMCAELAWCLARNDGIDLGETITPSGLVQAALERGAPLTYLEQW